MIIVSRWWWNRSCCNLSVGITYKMLVTNRTGPAKIRLDLVQIHMRVRFRSSGARNRGFLGNLGCYWVCFQRCIGSGTSCRRSVETLLTFRLVYVSSIAILILDALTNAWCSASYILEPVVPDDAPTVWVLLVLLPLVTNHPILHCLSYALLADSAIRVTDGCCKPREAFGLPFYPLEAPLIIAYLV